MMFENPDVLQTVSVLAVLVSIVLGILLWKLIGGRMESRRQVRNEQRLAHQIAKQHKHYADPERQALARQRRRRDAGD